MTEWLNRGGPGMKVGAKGSRSPDSPAGNDAFPLWQPGLANTQTLFRG